MGRGGIGGAATMLRGACDPLAPTTGGACPSSSDRGGVRGRVRDVKHVLAPPNPTTMYYYLTLTLTLTLTPTLTLMW